VGGSAAPEEPRIAEAAPSPRTLLFCTSFSDDPATWADRYERWLRYIRNCGVRYDRLIFVDDASPVLPGWPDVPVYSAEAVPNHPARESIHRFPQRLGQAQNSDTPFPGWYRSFGHALAYAAREGFDRVLHIESDAYLLSERAIELFNTRSSGWIAPWCRVHGWPESTLQIINADSLSAALEFFGRPYVEHARADDVAIETRLPLTEIDRTLVGDRYGEISDQVPFGADFVSQIRWDGGDTYFWWTGPRGGATRVVATPLPSLIDAYGRETTATAHTGIDYLEFLTFLDANLLPTGFFEIGTHEGGSLARFSCPALCVDPAFAFPGQVIGRKERLFLFQMTSDRFFAEHDPRR
jgi:hypothetical protein